MTSGAIVILSTLNFWDLFLHNPSPHGFKSIPLQSGLWDNKSIKELLLEKKKVVDELKNSKDEVDGLVSDLKDSDRAEVISRMHADSKNGALKEIREAYPEYFDEESGNTSREGLHELSDYLKREIRIINNQRKELKNEYDEIIKAIEEIKAVEENKNIIIPFITLYSPILFSVSLTIFSFFIYFNLIDIDLSNFYMPDIVIPTIITSTVLFIWEYYRLYSKIRKYYITGKMVYMFCKEKIQKFIKSWYKN